VNKVHRRGSLRPLYTILAVVAVIILVHVWINRLYALKTHVALGYGAVYAANMIFELATRYGGAVIYMFIALLAVRPLRDIIPSAIYRLVKVVVGVLGWAIGYGVWSLNASQWLLYFHHQTFPVSDPIFHMNESFYVYVLPIWLGVLGRIIGTLLLFMAVRALFLLGAFAQQQLAMSQTDLATLVRRQVRVLLALGSLLFLCFAALSVLDRYELAVTSSNGSFIYGPDFVIARLTIPIFTWIHIALLVVVAVSLAWMSAQINHTVPVRDGFAIPSWRTFKRPLYALGAYAASLALTAVVGGLVGTLYVHPNQNTVELPYIKNTIEATRWAFHIDNVQTKQFSPSDTLTSSDVAKDNNALQNVRVNDQGQTTTIYNQLQSFKSYFNFTPASVDRYNDSEVYVSARQMDVSKLPVQTWVNKTLVYTHGYGVAISPVNQFDSDGLPTMWAKNTPQETQTPIPSVTEPRIYFGMMDNNVIAPSKQSEFDYPVGAQDQASNYTGGAALPIRGNRLLLALQEGSLKFFTSDQITDKSQWLFDRNIYQRVADIAPFLRYDQDAFPFIDGQGHIQWMLDAYTESSNIPYAQQFMGAAYIRNSVKVVMDAYTGKTTFYVIDKSDPMIQTMMQTYPTLFTTDVPADISAHFRYPQDLFQAQASAVTRYHITNPSAFFNQEDQWDLATQIYQQNETAVRPPVYQMVRMPDRTKPEFVLSELFTPHQKQNLNGWMVADNEPDKYGQLSVYQFPQSSLILGPMQAENQIDSNPNISSQLTLWNQQGSHVVRGDLLLIPVGNAILYVEPIYLVANRDNALPQLERVIVNFNKQVYIDTSLGAAIQDLLQGTGGASVPVPNTPPGGQATGPGPGTGPGTPPVGGTTVNNLATQADKLFQQYESDTAKGDFEAAGKDLKMLGDVLSQLKQLGGNGGK
jgi:uncharacterized protein